MWMVVAEVSLHFKEFPVILTASCVCVCACMYVFLLNDN